MSTGEILTVIAATAAALVSVVNAVAAGWGRKLARVRGERTELRGERTEDKIDAIHDLTNGNMMALKDQLAKAQERISVLEALVPKK